MLIYYYNSIYINYLPLKCILHLDTLYVAVFNVSTRLLD